MPGKILPVRIPDVETSQNATSRFERLIGRSTRVYYSPFKVLKWIGFLLQDYRWRRVRGISDTGTDASQTCLKVCFEEKSDKTNARVACGPGNLSPLMHIGKDC
ncbi:MAG: hypothetical protein ACM3W7_05510, partial [Acidobacteriota bacterium]